MGKLFRRDTLETENKINDAVTSSDCRVLKYKSVLLTYSVEVSRIICRCMVIVHHQIALGEATTLTLRGMNDQLCLIMPFVSARLTLDSRKLRDLDS